MSSSSISIQLKKVLLGCNLSGEGRASNIQINQSSIWYNCLENTIQLSKLIAYDTILLVTDTEEERGPEQRLEKLQI